MTAGRGPRHAGRKGGAPVRKSITTRYFYSTAVLLICSIAVMGFIQMYLAMGYFREENGTALIQTIDNAILAMQEAADDGIVEKRAEAAEAAGLDVEDIKRGITLTARAAGKSILVTDAYGSVVLSIPSEYQGMEVSVKTCNATYSRGIYDEMGTLGGIFSSRYYIAGKPILDEKGMLQGFVFAGANADSLTEYLANLFSTFILSAGLMLMVSSVLSIVLTNRMTTPLRRISDAAKKFGGGDFSARVPVEGDDELAQLAETFNTMAGSLEKIDQSRRSFMGNIAHELRTPMTTIKGFIDGMLDGTIPPENQNHYLGIVSQEVGRLTRLIKNMLDITKLEAGGVRRGTAAGGQQHPNQRLRPNQDLGSGGSGSGVPGHLQSGGQRYQVLQCGRGDPFFRHTEQGRRYRRRAQHRRGYCARGAALCVRPLLQGRQKPWAEHHRKRPGSAYLQSPHQFVRRQDLGGQQGGRILRIPVHVARAAFFAH